MRISRLIVVDLFAAVPTALWLLLFYWQADSYTGDWDFGVYIPFTVGLFLLAVIVVCNFTKRGAGLLAWIAGMALVGFLPFAALLGGGV